MNKYIYRSDAANNIKELQDMATPDWSDADHKSFQLKNHTHVKKIGHNSEFLFGIYWWTWKTNYLKNCWSGSIKTIYNAAFL